MYPRGHAYGYAQQQQQQQQHGPAGWDARRDPRDSGYGYAQNPELLVVHNPETAGRAVRRGNRKSRPKSSNPALYKKIGGHMVSLGELIRRYMGRMLKGKKGGKVRFSKAFTRARKKAIRQFKKGVVYHQGLRLRIVGVKGYRAVKRKR